MKTIIAIALGAGCLASVHAVRAQDPGNARFYFGHIEAPCHPSNVKPVAGTERTTCDELLDDIRALGSDCQNVDEPCERGQRVLSKLFGDTYRNTLPDFMLYLEHAKDTNKQPIAGKFVGRRPILMWQDMNTPHLFGVRDIYALVFSDHKMCIDGTVATEYKSQPNPFSFLFTVLGKTFSGDKAKEDEREPLQFTWYPLSGDPENARMWYAVARGGIDVHSTNRITVRYRQPKASKPAAAAAAGDQGKEKPAAEKPAAVTEECDPAKLPPTYSGDFLAANAFFSNSSDSQVTVALALGVTFNAQGTSVTSGGSDVNYNGYALIKFYPERFRPRLHAGPRQLGPRPSWGLVIGTNIVNSPFDELIVGVSRGHIWGNVGVTVGINSIEGTKDTDQGRKERLFLGLDYSF